MRFLASVQITHSVSILAGALYGPAAAGTTALLAGAAQMLGIAPTFTESMGAPKEPIGGWVVLMSALGALSFEGLVPGALVGSAVFAVGSIQNYFMPRKVIELYQTKKPVTPLAINLLKTTGAIGASLAAYLKITADGGSHARGLAASGVINMLNMLKYAFFDAANDGVDFAGVFVWALYSGAIAALALQK